MSASCTKARPKQLLRGVVVALLVTMLAGCDTARTQRPGPNDPQARMHPELLEVSDSPVHPGQTIKVRFPEETNRGIAWVLEEQDRNSWHVRYYLTAVTDGDDGARSPSWWSVDAEEGKGWVDIGVEGPGPDTLIIPDSIRPGTYRLCTANSVQNICTTLGMEE